MSRQEETKSEAATVRHIIDEVEARQKIDELCHAAMDNNIPDMQKLIRQGTDINGISSDELMTALMCAAFYYNEEAINFLCQQPGIDAHFSTHRGESALSIACDQRHDLLELVSPDAQKNIIKAITAAIRRQATQKLKSKHHSKNLLHALAQREIGSPGRHWLLFQHKKATTSKTNDGKRKRVTADDASEHSRNTRARHAGQWSNH
jgi:hypothetical protein